MSNEGTITDVRLMLGNPLGGGRTTVLGSTGQGDLDQGTIDALLGSYSLEDLAAADPKPGDPLTTNTSEPLIGAYVAWPPSGDIDQGGTLVFCVYDIDLPYLSQRNKEPLDNVEYGDEIRFTQHGDLVLIASGRDPWTYYFVSQLQGEGSLYIEKQSGAKAKLSGGIDQVFVTAMPAGHDITEFAAVFGPFYKQTFGGGVKIKDGNGNLIEQYGGL
jgi:hypothetical protein